MTSVSVCGGQGEGVGEKVIATTGRTLLVHFHTFTTVVGITLPEEVTDLNVKNEKIQFCVRRMLSAPISSAVQSSQCCKSVKICLHCPHFRCNTVFEVKCTAYFRCSQSGISFLMCYSINKHI